MNCNDDHECVSGEEFKSLHDCLDNCDKNSLSSTQKKIIRIQMFDLLRRNKNIVQTKVMMRQAAQHRNARYQVNLENELNKYTDRSK